MNMDALEALEALEVLTCFVVVAAAVTPLDWIIVLRLGLKATMISSPPPISSIMVNGFKGGGLAGCGAANDSDVTCVNGNEAGGGEGSD